MRRIAIVADGATYPGKLVDRDRDAGAAAADDDAAVGAAGDKRVGNRLGAIRVVDSGGGMRAQVQHVVALFGEEGGEIPLQVEAGMVCTQGNPHEALTILRPAILGLMRN